MPSRGWVGRRGLRGPDEDPWRPLTEASIADTPDAFGVCEIADSGKRTILIAHGALREELGRILADPRTQAYDARYFRIHLTLLQTHARELAERLLQAHGDNGEPRPFFGSFPPATGLLTPGPARPGVNQASNP